MQLNKMEDKKRPRSVNWETAEKDALLYGVKAHVNVLEDKKKLASCNKQKEECWRDIQQKLSTLGYHRDLSRIREQWQRMKATAKKNILSYKRSLQAAGNGPKPVEPTETDYFIAEIIPQEFIDDTNPSDYDADLVPESDGVSKHDIIDIKTSKECMFKVKSEEEDKEDDNYIEVHPIEPIQYPEVVLSPIPVKPKRYKSEKRRLMTEYEEKMLELNTKKIEKSIAESEELHKLRVKHEIELHNMKIKAEEELMQLKIKHAEMKIKHEEEIHKEKLKKIRREL